MDMSLFHIHTIGKATINKEPYTPLLEVFPIEKLAYVDGEIVDTPEDIESDGEDAFGNAYSVKTKSSNSIKATWFPFGSNRMTPPDIRRGERVLLWRYADTDMYYWTSTGLDDFLRRLETVVYAFSNTTDEGVKKLTTENSVFIEVSTHLGVITLSTPKNHGEKFAYKFQFNYRKGIVILMDDAGNYFEMDSNERSIVLKNGDGSILSLDKMIALLATQQEINLKTKAYSLDCTTAVVNASTSITTKTGTYTMNATTSTITSVVNINGATTIQGNTAITGGFGLTGNADINGALKNNGIAVGSTHKHTGNLGAPTSTPN